MAELLFDFADDRTAGSYPTHGWAENSPKIKLLWLPIRRVLQNTKQVRISKGVSQDVSSECVYYSHACLDTLLKLTKVYQELSAVVRDIQENPADFDNTDSLDRFNHANDLVPLFADLAVVYLRRFADQLTNAARPILFDHYGSAPREAKKLLAPEFDPTPLLPLYDLDAIHFDSEAHSSWFWKLRGFSSDAGKGIRDALEHRATKLVFSQQRSTETTVHVHLYGWEKDVRSGVDLLAELRAINASLCQFLTAICVAAEVYTSYDRWDSYIRPGLDSDYVAMWPQIGV